MRTASVSASNGRVSVLSVAEIRRWVASRRTRAWPRGWTVGLLGGRAEGGYCLLGDLSSNTSRQAARARAWARCEPVASNPLPVAQPPALVEIKNSLYYTSHSAPCAPAASPPAVIRLATLRSLLPSTLLYGPLFFSRSSPPLSLSLSHSLYLLVLLLLLLRRATSRVLFSPLFVLRPPLIIFRRSGGASFARTDLI